MARKKASSAAAASAATPVSVPVDALAQELPVLESDSFDCNAYIHSKCHPVSEKGVRKLYSEVLQLKRQFADIVRKNVYANYTSFIWATQTIADLEGSLHGVQNLLSSQAAGIQGLRDIFPLSTLLTNDHETIVEESSFSEDEPDLSDAERSARGLQDRLEVFLAEKKVDEALAALKMGEQMVREQDRKNLRGSLSPTTVASLQVMLSYMRDRLVKELVEATQKPSVCGTELRAAVSALDRLGDGAHAHSLLLSSHLKRLRHHIKSLRPSGTSYGGAYTAALSQLVFSAIAQATKDSGAVFGPENTYASELFLWACQVIKMFVVLVKRHVLSSSAAAGGLRAAAECVQIALGHCLLLENQGLVLCPFLSSQVRPSVKQALQANVKRIAENTTALAAADDWVLTSFPRNSRTRRQSLSSITDSTSTPRFQLSSSAHNFYSMIQDFLEGVSPLTSLQLARPTFDALTYLYGKYVNLLIKALPKAPGPNVRFLQEKAAFRKVNAAGTLNEQLALFENAVVLANMLLPDAAAKLTKDQRVYYRYPSSRRQGAPRVLPPYSEKDWKLNVQQVLDKLCNCICTVYASEVIHGKEGEVQLKPASYAKLEKIGTVDKWQKDAVPSQIFQILFHKLCLISQVASEVVSEKERVTNFLLKCLVEKVVDWLSKNIGFWKVLEEGPHILGLIGLHQLVLDMQFVTYIASDGGYTSKMLQECASDNIARACNAFALNGGDPIGGLCEDKWFLDASKKAKEKLCKV